MRIRERLYLYKVKEKKRCIYLLKGTGECINLEDIIFQLISEFNCKIIDKISITEIFYSFMFDNVRFNLISDSYGPSFSASKDENIRKLEDFLGQFINACNKKIQQIESSYENDIVPQTVKQSSVFNKKPRIFKINNLTDKSLQDSEIHVCNVKKVIVDTCDKCGEVDIVPVKKNITLPKNYTKNLKLSSPVFFGMNINEFFTAKLFAMQFTENISGSRFVEVDSFNQDGALLQNQIGSIAVTGRCKRAFRKSFLGKKESLLFRCSKCFDMYGIQQNVVKDKHLYLDYNSWNGSDITELDYAFNQNVVVTEKCKKQIELLGFKNLEYDEFFWRE